jgi:DNA-binding response OmpR family regulator
MAKVLLSPGVSRSLELGLWSAGYEVARTASAADLVACTGDAPPSGIVVGSAPNWDATSTTAALREHGYLGAVVVLARADGTTERVAALNAGADDCIAQPADPAEVAARLRAVLRRAQPTPNAVLRIADLTVDRLARRVVRAEVELDLTPTEYSVLEYFAQRPGRLVTRDMLLADVWQDFLYAESNVVAKYINILRRKVERAPLPRLIHTVRGRGYVLSVERPAADPADAELATAH